MTRSQIVVNAIWDDEARVWVTTSEDVQGLAIEAATMEALSQRVMQAILDLVEENRLEADLRGVPVRIKADTLAGILHH